LKGTAADLVGELFRKEVDKEAIARVVAAMEDETLTPETLAQFRTMLSDLKSGTHPERSLQDLINLRSTSYQIADKLEAAGDMKQALVMQDLAASVNSRLDEAAKTGGISSEQLQQLRDADKQFGASKELYDTGIIKSQIRAEHVDPSMLAGRSLDFSPATVRKLKKIIATGADDAEEAYVILNQYRKTLITELLDKATNVTGEITPGAMKRALRMRSRMPMLKELFDRPHIRRLERLYDDLISQEKVNRVGRAASRGQSVTAQRLTGAQSIMAEALAGGFDNLPIIGKPLSLLRRQGKMDEAQRLMAGMLFDAAMDPEKAKELMKVAREPLPPSQLLRLLQETLLASGVSQGVYQSNSQQ
jgi:hypothetical protein